MARDPVCGTQVDEQQATHKSESEGQTYHLCLSDCKQRFEQNLRAVAYEINDRP